MAEEKLFGVPVEDTPLFGEPVDEDDGKQFYDDTAIGEIGEGIVSGVIGIGEGLAGLGALAVDVVADTNYGDQVTEAAEAARDALGLDPEGILGKGAEIITQFVVPGVGVASKVGKAAMAARKLAGKTGAMTKAERFSLAGKELAAAGAVDAAVTTDGMTTVGDWVDMGPTQTSDLIGLSGREKALARMGNKLKIGAEATLLGGVAQGALMGAGKVLGGAGKTIGQTKIGQVGAKAVNEKLDKVGRDIDSLLFRRMTEAPENISTLERRTADIIAFGRYRGYLPGQVATKRELLDGQVQIQVKKADRILKDLDSEIDTFIKKTPEGEGNLDRAGVMSKVESYLTEADASVKARVLSELPRGVQQNARRMRKHIDTLSDDVLKSNFLKEKKFTVDGKNINDIVEQNINTYLRRRYKIFEDAKYVPTEDSVKAADSFFVGNRTATEKELTKMAQKDVDGVFSDDFLLKNGLTKVDTEDGLGIKIEAGTKVTPAMAKLARENFLGEYSIKARESLGAGRMARDRLDTGMFMSRKNVPDELRLLLGEIKDPREAYLGTVADLSQFTAVDDYFGTVAKMARNNDGIGKLFRDGNSLSPQQQAGLRERGYIKLGGEDGASSGIQVVGREADAVEKLVGRSGWGELDGFYVPAPIYKNLTRQVLAEDSIGAVGLRALFGSFLKLKGISQYSKTVLSPITQVRNLTTALAFATANGNIPIFGRGGSLKDSAQAVFANITNKGSDKVFDDLADAQRRGVLGTNAELREIQDSLNKGIGITARDPKDFIEAVAGTGGGVREKLARSIGKVTKPLEAAYQGSDDFWKYFNYNAEQTHLRNALKGSSIDEQVAYLSKGMDPIESDSLFKNSVRSKGGTGDLNADYVDELIKNRAAQIVRDTVPNYNKASSELVQLGRRLPVGNFISFPAEIYRTGFNIVKQGLDDLASGIEAIQTRGRNRLLGFATTTAVVPAAALEIAYATTGVGREEMDAYKRSFAPRWEKGSVLLPLGKTEDGKIKYVNFSTSNPYDVLSRFTNRAINEADDAVKQGKDLGQVLEDVALGTLSEVFEPFMSEAMLTESLLDVTIRGGKTATGAQVYSDSDSFGARQGKKFAHVIDTLMPNVIPVNVSGGKIEPSRVVRGFLGSEDGMISSVDKMGRERNALSEFARQATGVSILEFDPKKGLEYGAYRLGQQQTDAKRKFNKVTDDFNAGTNTLTNAFQDANNDKLRIDREYYRMIDDLRDMGMTDVEIRRVLKKNNIGGVKGIMRGKFEPFKVTKKNRQEMRGAGISDKFDNSAAVEIQRQMRNIPLDPAEAQPAPVAPRPAQTPMFGVPAPDAPQPVQTPMFGVPVEQGSLPQPTFPVTTARAPGPVNPALLGDNPFSAAANAQIAARLQQT
tara:strand:- start:53 stop:4207 length:4155 start_codon:yes stop_codon:yes gene_type:complete